MLGLVWQQGPCSAYVVRRTLLDSPSRGWSGSAGAIYPLLRRLEEEGLLAGAVAREGKRRRREYAVTDAGRAALKRWIGPPLGPEVVTVASDPLRTRARFLSLLSPKERAAWVVAARVALDEVAESVRRWDDRYAAGGDPILAALTAHADFEAEARRKWLDALGALTRAPSRKPSARAPRG